VLDVGCGVGATPCWLAKKYGCKVVAVDILKNMIKSAKARAKRMGVEDKVTFRVADAHKLPFKANTFDVVMSECVLALIDNRKKALKEYVRVVKKGGLVGSNEVIWIKPPPKKLVEETVHLTGTNIPDPKGWMKLFKSAGLKKVTSNTHTIDMKDEFFGRMERYGWGSTFSVLFKAIKLLLTDPKYIKFIKEAMGTPLEIVKYWGYVVVVGKK
jgi:ubiquinone/menaquinone biosynthesis C-methylase UbiE